ncbi:DUF58 domain-containing protein [Granulosicoccus antarcticus]|uniref:DUF58 domain-containing protein n=1 Tax=Granulosicoccus antarcticus IMCC3135 TaxID=1192854 RepID=A0A2Z2NK01_9GAMM|nr:MxaS protein [Granulosicoccus antarcticus]ASJ70208.1 hypothetical protein IMCC3135_00410 [Granulosicoccus antarcticus IMCC3135]
MSPVSEFVYRIPGKPGSSRPGAHRSNARGPGLAFANYVRLIDQPDPRRLDLRASIRSVNRDWLVRATRQQSATVIQAIVDVSASMSFGSPVSKLDVAADFMESLGHSAFGYGDALGMVAFDHEPREDLTLTARTGRGVGMIMADILRSHSSAAQSKNNATPMQPQSLNASAFQVSHGASMVFLLSDFHWPLEYLEDTLDLLSHVTVIPIVIWDKNETQPPAAGRWLRTRDSESGKQHNLLMRKSTIRQWQENVSQKRTAINTLFAAHAITPLYMEAGFDAEHLTRYFLETAL